MIFTEKDIVNFYGLPLPVKLLIFSGVSVGIEKARNKINTRYPIIVNIAAGSEKIFCIASTSGKNNILILFNLKKWRLYSKKYWILFFAKKIVHEYIHCLRNAFSPYPNKKYSTIKFLVEEGIACYSQTIIIGGPPEYIETRLMKDKIIKSSWKKYQSIMHERANLAVMPSDNTATTKKLEDFYRLGYYIVCKYIEKNPNFTLKKLIKIEPAVLIHFAREFFKE